MVGYVENPNSFFYGSPRFTGRVFMVQGRSGLQPSIRPGLISQNSCMDQIGVKYMTGISEYDQLVRPFITAVPPLKFAVYANSAHSPNASHRNRDSRRDAASPASVYVVSASLPLGFEHELSLACRSASSARSHRLHPTCTSSCRSPRWRLLREMRVVWARKRLLHIFPHASCWVRLGHGAAPGRSNPRRLVWHTWQRIHCLRAYIHHGCRRPSPQISTN
ncbi:hypothetical protein BGW80DRAFT_865069 [Lactifluus volemus]|nr:hypothetical protein BGW80DRAFT_865069 [Lactifluus volemus]